jgi:hypothetical protein
VLHSRTPPPRPQWREGFSRRHSVAPVGGSRYHATAKKGPAGEGTVAQVRPLRSSAPRPQTPPSGLRRQDLPQLLRAPGVRGAGEEGGRQARHGGRLRPTLGGPHRRSVPPALDRRTTQRPGLRADLPGLRLLLREVPHTRRRRGRESSPPRTSTTSTRALPRMGSVRAPSTMSIRRSASRSSAR